MSNVNRSDVATDESMPGEDSFLDIVANIVGILIILVMVVGVRASQGSLTAPLEEAAVVEHISLFPQVSPTNRESLVSEVSESDEQILKLRREIALDEQENLEQLQQLKKTLEDYSQIAAEREQLLAIQSLQEQDLAERRARLDERSREEFDVLNELQCKQREHQELTEERFSLIGRTGEIEQVVNYPTPLAKSVTEDAIHVRLKGGRLALIPFDALRYEVSPERRRSLQAGARQQGMASELAGPIDGFRMRMFRETIGEEVPVDVSPMFARAKVKEKMTWELLPMSEELGTPIQQALLPNSEFMQTVKRRASPQFAVVAWIYPDAYDDLQLLRQALWREGAISLAPFPWDQSKIVFSTDGIKPRAQ